MKVKYGDFNFLQLIWVSLFLKFTNCLFKINVWTGRVDTDKAKKIVR